MLEEPARVGWGAFVKHHQEYEAGIQRTFKLLVFEPERKPAKRERPAAARSDWVPPLEPDRAEYLRQLISGHEQWLRENPEHLAYASVKRQLESERAELLVLEAKQLQA